MYMGMRHGWNQPEDYVEYVRNDMMGVSREDLVYDVARHVDSSVHMFEEWGLPFWYDDEGLYVREGRWQVMIHGEAYKPIVSEATKKAIGPDNHYERVFISHLFTDADDPGRIAGAVGFGVREDVIYIFKARSVISAAGGATAIFRPRSVGEGMGRTWYSIFDTGSVYGLIIPVGGEMTQMEHRFVPSRFKDSYGPVGAWSQLFRADLTNAAGENYFINRLPELKKYDPYGSAFPTPTPLRNHLLWTEIQAGNGPIMLKTPEAIDALAAGDEDRKRDIIAEAWEDFLDMTISQAILWAAHNIAPEERPSEVVLAEPYIMGSHSGEAGAWVSGPEDVAPDGYHWGYSKMTTVNGLFAAGDGVGACPHKFSSGSFTEGRLAGKSAVAYALDNTTPPKVDDRKIDELKRQAWAPMVTFEENQYASTNPEVNPNYLLPRQGLFRLQKLMDEYVAGRVGRLHHQRIHDAAGPGADGNAARGPGKTGRPQPPRVAPVPRADSSRLGRRGSPAPHAAPQGNPLARLLLPQRLPRNGRTQLARVRQLPLQPRKRRVERLHPRLPAGVLRDKKRDEPHQAPLPVGEGLLLRYGGNRDYCIRNA